MFKKGKITRFTVLGSLVDPIRKCAYRVQVEESLVMFVHWRNSLYCVDIFLISQVEMRERDDDRSTWRRKRDYVVGEIMDKRGEWKKREKR